MRPDDLTPLFAPVETLKGIGPRLAVLMKKALRLPPGVRELRVLDLLWHLPTGVVDRRAEPTVADDGPGRSATVRVRVLNAERRPRGLA